MRTCECCSSSGSDLPLRTCTEGALDLKGIFESFQDIIKSASAFPFSSIRPSRDSEGGPITTAVFKTINQDSRLSHLVIYLTTIFKDLEAIFFTKQTLYHVFNAL